jgi:hypothetical protein
MTFPSALEISRQAPLKPSAEIAASTGIGRHLLEPYGNAVAKIRLEAMGAGRPAAGQVRGDPLSRVPPAAGYAWRSGVPEDHLGRFVAQAGTPDPAVDQCARPSCPGPTVAI